MSAPALPGFAELAPVTKDDRTGALCPVCGRRGACRCSARGWDALTIDQALAAADDEHQDEPAGCPGCGSDQIAGPGLWCTACVIARTAERYAAEDRGNYRERRHLAREHLARLDAGEPPDLHTLYGRAADAMTTPDRYDLDPHPHETPQMPPGAWRRACRAVADELAAAAGTTRPLSPDLAAEIDHEPAPPAVADVPTGALF